MKHIKQQTQQELYEELFATLSANLNILDDKPEESVEATLKALWFAACGLPKSAQLASREQLPDLVEEQILELEQLCEKRIQGVPLAHLTGRQHFMGVELLANKNALIPRKETELLGYAALDILNSILEEQDQARVIDVCTGAGNLPIAYAINKQAVDVYASDLSHDAVSLAQSNVEYHNLQDRVKLKVGSLLEPFDSEEFYNAVDLITCNPPYISSAKVETMHSEISNYEPRLAFDGGPFGIKILNLLIREAPKYLKQGGWLAFEVGLGQGPSMIKVIDKSGKYSRVQPVVDASGQIRVIQARI